MSKEIKKWMPMFWSDYFAKTRHLTCLQHGAYLQLIGYYWLKGKLPTDDKLLARIVGVPTYTWVNEIREAVGEFFNGDWTHDRIEAELAYAIEKSKRLSANAKLRLSRSRASAGASADTPTPTPTKKERKNMAAYAAEFDEFWKSKPSRKGDNPKHPARLSYERAIKSGADPGQINAAAKRWARQALEIPDSDRRFVPRAVTWLNQRRFEDYQSTPEDAAKEVVSDEFMRTKGFIWDGEKWARANGEAQTQA